MKERKLYSLTGKLIVFLLLIVFAASTLFGGIQTLMLSSVGLTPNVNSGIVRRIIVCGIRCHLIEVCAAAVIVHLAKLVNGVRCRRSCSF